MQYLYENSSYFFATFTPSRVYKDLILKNIYE